MTAGEEQAVEHTPADPQPLGQGLAEMIPYSFFREHPGLLHTASYLLLIVIGLVYEVWLFFRFRLNILYYAEATDFLLVPFREPLVMLISIAPLPLYILYIRLVNWVGPRIPVLGKKYRDAMAKNRRGRKEVAISATAIFLWAVAFSANYAQYVEEAIREGRRKDITIEVTSGARVVGPLIGTTSQFVFVYDRVALETNIVQTENVARIIVASPPRPRDD